jgi:GT2 family glycosyltransferase
MILPASPNDPRVSIVIATYNRCARLAKCLDSVARNVTVAHEVIVVGGGTGDGTEELLAARSDVRFIAETRREGAARAYNKGFRAARAEFVMWLNDDSWPLPGSVEAALEFHEREANDDVGMVAFYHNEDRAWNKLDTIEHAGATFSIYNVRGTPFANFGLLRRDLLERVGYLDEGFYYCGWDPDLALKIQRREHRRVIGCRAALIHHEEHLDERKRSDQSTRAESDNARLFAKWALPEKFTYPDPTPAYLEMLADRGLA